MRLEKTAREILKISPVLEYFRCVTGNTAEACSCCSSRSDADMLRVWFTCSPFMPSKHGACANTNAPLQACTKDEQHKIVRLGDGQWVH
jgi:hypothetical protein